MVWYLSCVILEIINELISAPNPSYKVLSILSLPVITDVCGCIWLLQMYHPVRTINILPVTSLGAWQIHRNPVQEVAWLHDKLFSPILYLPPHILANQDLNKQSCGMNSAKCSRVHRAGIVGGERTLFLSVWGYKLFTRSMAHETHKPLRELICAAHPVTLQLSATRQWCALAVISITLCSKGSSLQHLSLDVLGNYHLYGCWVNHLMWFPGGPYRSLHGKYYFGFHVSQNQ